MQKAEKLIKVTKKNGSSSIVPASQRSVYESFNEKAQKLKKPDDVVKIEDYEEPASEETAGTGLPPTSGSGSNLGILSAVLDMISSAKTPEQVDEIIDGDARQEVLEAAATRKAELQSNPPGQRKATDVIADISNAKTAEEVDALIKGDDRKTVLAAAEQKKSDLAKN